MFSTVILLVCPGKKLKKALNQIPSFQITEAKKLTTKLLDSDKCDASVAFLLTLQIHRRN